MASLSNENISTLRSTIGAASALVYQLQQNDNSDGIAFDTELEAVWTMLNAAELAVESIEEMKSLVEELVDAEISGPVTDIQLIRYTID